MLLTPLLNIKTKVYLQISKNLAQFCCPSLFQVLKKVYLQILKNLLQFFFAYILFQILKKVYLQILKYPFYNNKDFKGNSLWKNHYTNISHKNYYTNNKHKLKIYNHCMHTHNYYKIFFSLPYNYKNFFSLLDIRMINQGLNLSLNELKLIAE